MDKTPGLQYYVPKEHLSVSSLCSFARCERLFFYQSGCKFRPLHEHIALTYGTAIHEAMPFAIRGDEVKAMVAFLNVWKDGDLEDDPKRNSGRANAIINEVILQHADPLYTPIAPPLSKFEIDATVTQDEVPFSLDIGAHVPFVGKIDATGRHRDTNGVYAVEYKTTSRMGSMFLGCFNYNPQCIAYALALTMMMEDESVDGAIVEALGVAKTSAKVALHIVNIREQQLEEFINWVLRQSARIQRCEETGVWQKDCSACTSYPQHGMAGFECKFKDFCLVSDWTALVDTMKISTYDLFGTTKKEPCDE